MVPNPFLGVTLHSIGGLAAGSFYIPFRKVKRWAWESYWLIQGLLAWIVMPSLVAVFTVPELWGVLCGTDGDDHLVRIEAFGGIYIGRDGGCGRHDAVDHDGELAQR